MGFPAGVGRDFEGLERRRMHAARLLAKGLSQSEVARRVGAHRQSVSRWAAELHAKGRAGLKKAGRACMQQPRLSAEQITQIERGLKRGPQALGGNDQPVDREPGSPSDRAGMRGELSPRARVEDPAAAGMELPATGGPGSGARRESHPGLEASGLAAD